MCLLIRIGLGLEDGEEEARKVVELGVGEMVGLLARYEEPVARGS